MRKIFCDFCDCEIKDARSLVGVNIGEVEAEACEKCKGKLLRLIKYHEWKQEEKAVTKQKQEGDEDPEGQQTSGQNETKEQAGQQSSDEIERTHGPRAKIDYGKVGALYKAHWAQKDIAAEMGISQVSVSRILSKMREEGRI